MSDTAEVTAPVIDLVAARELCRKRNNPIGWMDYANALDEIERLRDQVTHLQKAYRLRANYRPERYQDVAR